MVEVHPPTDFACEVVWSTDLARYMLCGYGVVIVRRMGDPLHAPMRAVEVLFCEEKGYRWKVGDEILVAPARCKGGKLYPSHSLLWGAGLEG